MSTDTYDAPEHGWTCFHCGETFEGRTVAGHRAAREHFGAHIDAIPGCRLRMRKGEVSLLRRIRWLETRLREMQYERLAENTEKDREIAKMRCDHTQALIREEEKGYERGLRDARLELQGVVT